jgi:hypothetical protein
MKGEEIAVLPARPESVAEWEELLVRLEIVPRVVRNTVDEVVDVAGASSLLAEAADRELTVGAWLESAASIGPRDRAPVEAVGAANDPTALALRFASLRARTFAMVQRRGLEVWSWEAPLEGGGTVTVHQLLSWLARRDAGLLTELRDATANGRVGC